MPTIKDVARRAGLSVMTVSRVLNDERHVSAEARARVQEAVQALGFRRNAFARGLPGARSFLICQLVPQIIGEYVAEFQQGAIAHCREHGYHLVAEPYDTTKGGTAEAVAAVIAALRPDGFLLLPPVTDDMEVLAVLERTRTPYVRIAPMLEPERASSISVDEVEASRRMTMALIDLGHRRIGFLAGPADHAASSWRLDGYRQALAARGLPFDAALIREGSGVFDLDGETAVGLLTLPDRPTAIFAFNDEMALGVVAATRRLGLEVPADVSVTGFDDGEIARISTPPLTTIRQPIRDMAAAATEIVMAQADGRGPKIQHRRFPFELVFRASTGRRTAG